MSSTQLKLFPVEQLQLGISMTTGYIHFRRMDEYIDVSVYQLHTIPEEIPPKTLQLVREASFNRRGDHIYTHEVTCSTYFWEKLKVIFPEAIYRSRIVNLRNLIQI